MSKSALGRGLGALLSGVPVALKSAPATPSTLPLPTSAPEPASAPREQVERAPLERIHPSILQPRKDFPAATLQELADSIKEQGIIQPLIVRAKGDAYELIAGERRWRAAQMLGLKEVPVLVRDSDDRTVLELMLIENLQRENLNAIEEAQGYEELITKFQLTQEAVAVKVGKSRAAVANALRLLKLAPEVQIYVRDGRLSVGHAKVILSLAGEAEQNLASQRILREGMSVRQAEALIADFQKRSAIHSSARTVGVKSTFARDAHLAHLETRLQERFGTKVALHYRDGKGALEIKFFNDNDLERILQLVGVNLEAAE